MLAKLKILKMWDMTRLRSVCSKAIELPALEKIQVNNCPLLVKLPITDRNVSSVKEIRGEMEWLNELMLQKQNEDNLRQIFQTFVASTSMKRKDLRLFVLTEIAFNNYSFILLFEFIIAE